MPSTMDHLMYRHGKNKMNLDFPPFDLRWNRKDKARVLFAALVYSDLPVVSLLLRSSALFVVTFLLVTNAAPPLADDFRNVSHGQRRVVFLDLWPFVLREQEEGRQWTLGRIGIFLGFWCARHG